MQCAKYPPPPLRCAQVRTKLFWIDNRGGNKGTVKRIQNRGTRREYLELWKIRLHIKFLVLLKYGVTKLLVFEPKKSTWGVCVVHWDTWERATCSILPLPQSVKKISKNCVDLTRAKKNILGCYIDLENCFLPLGNRGNKLMCLERLRPSGRLCILGGNNRLGSRGHRVAVATSLHPPSQTRQPVIQHLDRRRGDTDGIDGMARLMEPLLVNCIPLLMARQKALSLQGQLGGYKGLVEWDTVVITIELLRKT